jgi:hypothetical protein
MHLYLVDLIMELREVGDEIPSHWYRPAAWREADQYWKEGEQEVESYMHQDVQASYESSCLLRGSDSTLTASPHYFPSPFLLKLSKGRKESRKKERLNGLKTWV